MSVATGRGFLSSVVIAVVSILAFVPVTSAQELSVDPRVDAGVHSWGTYDGGRESVSLQSGNLHFCIPLVSLPGRNKHDLNIPLCYNSQFRELHLLQGDSSNVPKPVNALAAFPWV